MTARTVRDRMAIVAVTAILVVIVATTMGVTALAAAGETTEHGQASQRSQAAEHSKAAAHSEGKPPSSGSTSEPQPPSNADFSGHGANVHGPYDSTRDGSPSENGNGDGKAVGKPCAGCVGSADNKNPPGQLPGGSDANAGYECDRNKGIGKSNPAHTSCKETTPPTAPPDTIPPTAPPDTTPPTAPPDTTPPDTTPPATPPGVTPPEATPPAIMPPQKSPPAAPGQPRVTPPGGLAVTGAVGWLLPIGAGLLLAGAGVIAASHRRPRARH